MRPIFSSNRMQMKNMTSSSSSSLLFHWYHGLVDVVKVSSFILCLLCFIQQHVTANSSTGSQVPFHQRQQSRIPTTSSFFFPNKSIYAMQQQKQTQTQHQQIVLLRGGAVTRSIIGRKQGTIVQRAPVRTKQPTTKTGTRTSNTVISGTGTASITNEIFNLVKNIVGVAVLSIPGSIAAFGSVGTSILLPCILYIICIGVLSGYGFYTIGKVCHMTNTSSYSTAWKQSINEHTSWIPSISSTCKTFLSCMAISMVLADTFKILLFGNTVDTNNLRLKTLITLTIGILLPLCWMKNLASLAPFSLIGILGIVYTSIAMTIRYYDKSYINPSSTLLQSIPIHMRPSFLLSSSNILTKTNNGWKEAYTNPKVLLLLCTLSSAFMAHFNSPKYYNELYNNTLVRYRTVVSISFVVSIVLMSYITIIGYITFGMNSANVILNNYSSNDTLMSLSRIAIAFSLLFTYPLSFQGCRDGILDILQISKKNRTTNVLNITTILVLLIITIFAALLNDVGFVLAIGGATLGNALAYIYPAIMFYGIVKKQNKLSQEITPIIFSILSAILGLGMGIIGTKLALQKAVTH